LEADIGAVSLVDGPGAGRNGDQEWDRSEKPKEDCDGAA
jgi:hypothetical protein